MTGRIAGAGAGVVVNLLEQGAAQRRAGGGQRDRGDRPGRAFSLAVPAGPSRRLRAARRVNPTDRYFVCSKALDVRVPARATLTASPRSLRAGSRVRLSGRLLGGRVPVARQADRRCRRASAGAGGRSRTVRTRASGAFSTRYRFRATAPRKTYPMRVRVRPDAAYPFAVGYSRSVKVRVR